MINSVTTLKTSDGQLFEDKEEAINHERFLELDKVICPTTYEIFPSVHDGIRKSVRREILEWMSKNWSQILQINGPETPKHS